MTIGTVPVESDRFRILRELGRGGLGTVFEAEDLEREQHVALKVLWKTDSHSLFRLKREFRSLAEVHHPNLVMLYDLFADGKQPFFTMELVAGANVLTYCVAAHGRPSADAQADTIPSHGWPMVSDEAKLRSVLPQLAAGLDAIHAAGLLHRDIKPSNVLVSAKGTVKILDFGLAVPADAQRKETTVGHAVGTAAYMSPEQALGDRDLDPVSDWYSVGVLLYELITGRLPFSGPSMRVLLDKQDRPAVPPRQLVHDVPKDLDALCEALLERDPAERPRPRQILERLGVADAELSTTHSTQSRNEGVTLAGRDAELAELRRVFEYVEEEGAHSLLIRGPSGIGKTALVQELLRHLELDVPDLVVLSGRCYESEHVPYRAMDGVIDELSRFWRKLSDLEAGGLLPRGAGRLRQLFPVLGRVPAVALREPPRHKEDPEIRRSRAYRALRELFQRLTDRRPTIVFLDDLQWVDVDSANLLSDLMRPPDPPHLLLLMASRDYPIEDTPALGELVAALGKRVQTIDLGPLAPDDCRRLAEMLASAAGPEGVARVASESDGNPFFLRELARHIQSVNDIDPGQLRLDEVLARRIAALPEPARKLLERICVAGEPINRVVAQQASKLDLQAFDRETRALRAASLIRAAGGRKEDHVEPYHDRIREVAVARLDGDALRRTHQDLAVALEASGTATEDQLARHWSGAGAGRRAAEHARSAAIEAVARSDFGRAAGWYQTALDVGNYTGEEARQLRIDLGEALAYAGRPLAAAQAFEQSLVNAERADALELRRRMMGQLLGGGYVEPGLAAARSLLADVGLTLPRSLPSTLLRLALGALRLRLRGLRWRRRSEKEIAASELVRVDIAFTVGSSLVIVDTLRAFACLQQSLRLALEAGEPERVARAAGAMAASVSSQGKVRRAARLMAVASAAAERAGSKTARAWLAGMREFSAFFGSAEWKRVIEDGSEALRLFREAGFGRSWETDTSLLYRARARLALGDLVVLAGEVSENIRSAARSGNRFLEVSLRSSFSFLHLVADDPEAARADLEGALAIWSDQTQSFQVQHLYALWGRCEAALYVADPAAAQRELDLVETLLARSLLLRVAKIRCEDRFLRGRIAVAGAASAHDANERRRLLGLARKHARKLARQRLPFARLLAPLLVAGIAHLESDRERTISVLHDAIERLDATETGLYAAAARRQLGRTLGDAEGQALIDHTDTWMREQRVVRPDRLAAVLVPGWPHPDA